MLYSQIQIRGNSVLFPWNWEVTGGIHENKYVIFKVFHLKSNSNYFRNKNSSKSKKQNHYIFSSCIPDCKEESQSSFKLTRFEVFFLLSSAVSQQHRKESVSSSSPPKTRQHRAEWGWGLLVLLVCVREEAGACWQQSPPRINLKLRRSLFQISLESLAKRVVLCDGKKTKQKKTTPHNHPTKTKRPFLIRSVSEDSPSVLTSSQL